MLLYIMHHSEDLLQRNHSEAIADPGGVGRRGISDAAAFMSAPV